MLLRWICDGTLEDPFNEFFIASDPKVSSDRLWHDKYSIRHSMIPKFMSLSWAKKILATGKSINFLHEVRLQNEAFSEKLCWFDDKASAPTGLQRHECHQRSRLCQGEHREDDGGKLLFGPGRQRQSLPPDIGSRVQGHLRPRSQRSVLEIQIPRSHLGDAKIPVARTG